MKSRIIVCSMVFLFLLSCEKIEIDTIHNLNNGKVFLIAMQVKGSVHTSTITHSIPKEVFPVH